MHIWEGKGWFGVFSLWIFKYFQSFGAHLNLAWASQALCMLFDLWLNTFRKTGSLSFHQLGAFWATHCLIPVCLTTSSHIKFSPSTQFLFKFPLSPVEKTSVCFWGKPFREKRHLRTMHRHILAKSFCWSYLPAHKLHGFFKDEHPASTPISTQCWCGLTMSAVCSSRHLNTRKSLSH